MTDKWEEAPTYYTDKHAASMTLRDHFAGLAMQGLINISRGATSSSMSPVYTALAAYEFADAMLKERDAMLKKREKKA